MSTLENTIFDPHTQLIRLEFSDGYIVDVPVKKFFTALKEVVIKLNPESNRRCGSNWKPNKENESI